MTSESVYTIGNDMAFPVLDRDQTPNGTFQTGLTKRELFAAMMAQGILAGAVTRACPADEWTDQSMAVKCADALLAELEKPRG